MSDVKDPVQEELVVDATECENVPGSDGVAGPVVDVPEPDDAKEVEDDVEVDEDDVEVDEAADDVEDEEADDEDVDLFERESSSSGAGSEEDPEELLAQEAAAAAARAAPTKVSTLGWSKSGQLIYIEIYMKILRKLSRIVPELP